MIRSTVRGFIRPIRRLARLETPALVLLLLFAASLWAFAELADEVRDGDAHAFDEAVLLSIRNADDPSDPIGPKWVEEIGRDLTALGGVAVLTLVTIAVGGYLVLEQKPRIALVVVIAVGGGLLVSSLLKRGFDRPRPDLVPHQSEVYTASFPSGHSVMAAVTYLTLAALLARSHERRSVKVFLIVLAIIVTALVGVSRIYVGVHWPTDVLAGWTAGAAWALLCWVGTAWLQQKGQVEGEGDLEE